jgi:hypothetical protein
MEDSRHRVAAALTLVVLVTTSAAAQAPGAESYVSREPFRGPSTMESSPAVAMVRHLKNQAALPFTRPTVSSWGETC